MRLVVLAVRCVCACRFMIYLHSPPQTRPAAHHQPHKHTNTQLIAVLLFQTLGAALIVNEYNHSGLVSSTLLRFSGLLAGLAFLPPLAVALRESLPSHARNPFVRAVAGVFEMALDVVSVGAIALLGSMLLTVRLLGISMRICMQSPTKHNPHPPHHTYTSTYRRPPRSRGCTTSSSRTSWGRSGSRCVTTRVHVVLSSNHLLRHMM